MFRCSPTTTRSYGMTIINSFHSQCHLVFPSGNGNVPCVCVVVVTCDVVDVVGVVGVVVVAVLNVCMCASSLD